LYGQTGTNATINRSVPIQIAASVNMGASPIIPINLTTTRGSSFTSVGLGTSFVAAISNTGTLYTWGANTNGQLGYISATTSSPATVGANTQAYKVGETSVGTNSWSQVSAGYNHALAIDSTKRLFGWGNYAGTNPIITATMSWKSFIADSVTIAIRSDDTLWTWGLNSLGQVGDGTTINRSSPIQLGTDTWKQISNGVNLVAGIKTNGTLWTWGYNNQGQLGDGTIFNRSSPVQVPGSWSSISCGLSATAGIKTDGTLWTWGGSGGGVLGDGTVIDKSSPLQIGTNTKWKQVKMAYSLASAIDVDSNLFMWGLNSSGELGLNDIVSRSSPVQVGVSKWISVGMGYSGGGYSRQHTMGMGLQRHWFSRRLDCC
jgi:alpha-tubulin suppressor-like RCC1 family protein